MYGHGGLRQVDSVRVACLLCLCLLAAGGSDDVARHAAPVQATSYHFMDTVLLCTVLWCMGRGGRGMFEVLVVGAEAMHVAIIVGGGMGLTGVGPQDGATTTTRGPTRVSWGDD
jgi:hypothetical protein